jgi:hypothetical protein
MAQYQQVKLVYPMGQVKILPLDQTVESQNLPDDATLVLMGMESFVWDKLAKEPGIEVSSHHSWLNTCIFRSTKASRLRGAVESGQVRAGPTPQCWPPAASSPANTTGR